MKVNNCGEKDMFVLCIMGKSGTGKSTLINKLIEKQPDIFSYIVSKTTRPVRTTDPNDINTHVFCNMHDLMKDIENKDIMAMYVDKAGTYMNWTSKSQFKKLKINLYAIDPIAASELYQQSNYTNYPMYVRGIYIDINETNRELRILNRDGITSKEFKEKYGNEAHLEANRMITDLYLNTLFINGDSVEEDANKIIELLKQVKWIIEDDIHVIKNNKNIVSSGQCFDEGISGNCGKECQYFEFDGCQYKGDDE